jgi:hypothetical protein
MARLIIAVIFAFLSIQLQTDGFFVQNGIRSKSSIRMAIFEGNPVGQFVWNNVWKLPMFQAGKPGQSPTTFGDAALVLKSNILQLYGGEPSVDGAPLATGEVEGLLEGSLFLGLRSYYDEVSYISYIYVLINSTSFLHKYLKYTYIQFIYY